MSLRITLTLSQDQGQSISGSCQGHSMWGVLQGRITKFNISVYCNCFRDHLSTMGMARLRRERLSCLNFTHPKEPCATFTNKMPAVGKWKEKLLLPLFHHEMSLLRFYCCHPVIEISFFATTLLFQVFLHFWAVIRLGISIFVTSHKFMLFVLQWKRLNYKSTYFS